MTDTEVTPLKRVERLIAGGMGLVLLSIAVALVAAPPDRQVALQNCPNAAAGCTVSVDNDLTTFSAALAAIGAATALIGILGIRITTIKVGGIELSDYDKEISGLPRTESQSPELTPDTIAAGVPDSGPVDDVPVKVELLKGLGRPNGAVPVALTRLTDRMREIDTAFLREYQLARRASQHSYFLTHILGPAKQPRQKYSVAIKVTPHRDATNEIRSVSFYLGRSWGNQVFTARRGPDGRFGIVTEAHGPFLALCELEFADESRIVLDHYCDFDMGSLLPA